MLTAVAPSDPIGAFLAGLGPDAGTERDPLAVAPRLVDWRGRRLGGAEALLRPRTVPAVQAIVRAAAAHGVALVPQGGLTGLVGGALPAGGRPAVLVSLERLAAVRSVDLVGMTLTAEAGVTLAAVQDAAEGAGLRFPLDLAARGSASVGGLVSTNAGGVRALRHGVMRARVLGLEAVLPSGDVLAALSPVAKDTAGYDVKQWLIGAEGTLGFVTAATLALAPPLLAPVAAWIGLPSPAAALALLAALRRATGGAVDAFELMPGWAGAYVAAHVPGLRDPLPGHAWTVLAEIDGPGAAAALETVLAAYGADAVVAASGAQAAALWAVREALPEAERREGAAVKHDIALPVGLLPAFLAEVTPAIEAGGARVIAFGHLGDGNLHYNVRPPLGADPPAWVAGHGAAVSVRVHDAVVARGGTIAAEHGIGAFKADELARVGDPVRLAMMRALKGALDPLGIMNPGKLAL